MRTRVTKKIPVDTKTWQGNKHFKPNRLQKLNSVSQLCRLKTDQVNAKAIRQIYFLSRESHYL